MLVSPFSTPTTVITASMPGREPLLLEAISSVSSQLLPPHAHLIRVQSPPGPPTPTHLAHQRNILLNSISTEWVSVLDDDDLYSPNHFEVITPYLTHDHDVIYSFCHTSPVSDVTDWDQETLITELRKSNYVTSNATIRTDFLRGVGGWGEEMDPLTGAYLSGAIYEDWDLWVRMAERGARFVCVPVPTWHYRAGNWPRLTAPIL